MSDVINGVPRELLERAEECLDFSERYSADRACGNIARELRALLSEQPQAGAGMINTFAAEHPEEWDHAVKHTEAQDKLYAAREALVAVGDESRCLELLDSAIFAFENLPADGEQSSAAQSAPAGEREAMDAAFHSSGLTKFKETYAAGWQARAAWQRRQSAGAPDGYVLVPIKPTIEMVEAGYEASLGMPDRSGHARAIEMFEAMLAAAPAQPAAQDQGDEVRSEWLLCSDSLPADKRDVLVYCADSDEHMVGSSIGGGLFLFATASHGEKVVCRPTHWRYIDESDKPALAASTGQEVE